MKICIIASRLFSGGFTTSMLNMANELVKNGIGVDLMFIRPDEHSLSLDQIKQFHVINVERTKAKTDLFFVLRQKKIKKEYQQLQSLIDQETDPVEKKKLEQRLLQKSIENDVRDHLPKMDLTEYDAVVSWEELNCNYFLAYNIKAKKKIGYVHPDYIDECFSPEVDFPAFQKLDYIAGVSQATTDDMKKVFPSLASKIVYINNVLDTGTIDQKMENAVSPFVKSELDLVTVCRILIKEKGLDRLLRVTSRLHEEGYHFVVRIVGGGEELVRLNQMIAELNATDYIKTVGEQTNPYPYVKNSDLFLLLSPSEGMPVVIEECMYLSVPALVWEYPSARQQVNDGVNGLIACGEEADIYNKLKDLLDHPEKLERLKNALVNEDKSRYRDVSRFVQYISSK